MIDIPCLNASRLQYRKRYYILNTSGAAVGKKGKTLTAIRPTEGKDGRITDELVPRPYRAHDPEVLYFRNRHRAERWLDANPHILRRFVKIESDELLCEHHMQGETKAITVLRVWRAPKMKKAKAKAPDAEKHNETRLKNKASKQRRFNPVSNNANKQSKKAA